MRSFRGLSHSLYYLPADGLWTDSKTDRPTAAAAAAAGDRKADQKGRMPPPPTPPPPTKKADILLTSDV